MNVVEGFRTTEFEGKAHTELRPQTALQSRNGLACGDIVRFPLYCRKTFADFFQQCRHGIHNDPLVGTRNDRASGSTEARPSRAGHCCRQAVAHPDIFGRSGPSVHISNSQRVPSMVPCPCARSPTHLDGR